MAKRSGVTEAAVRFYIKTHNIDRRYDKKVAIIEECRKYFKGHPDATMNEVATAIGCSHSTVKTYWDNITANIELTDFDSNKIQNNQAQQLKDFYAPHPSVTQDILKNESFNNYILEPFCGNGTMAEVIKSSGYSVSASDRENRGYGEVKDFRTSDFPANKYDIITNPPYDSYLCDNIIKCLKTCKEKVAILMPLSYISGKTRYTDVFKKNPPTRIYAYIDRIGIAKNADFKNYSDIETEPETHAWYVWEKGCKGETTIKWIENQSYIERGNFDEVTILNGLKFHPNETFSIPISDCIQFHSKALPENQIMSNHYDCIIKFRGVEFYSVEQLFMGLTYSDSPNILREVMTASSGTKAKSICREKYEDNRDWDFLEKKYRVIAICHLYKYLSVKEYRDRLRETYPQTLVECPMGKDYHFGVVFNYSNNNFEGNNCSGRTTMIVRDMMKSLEDTAITTREKELGRILTKEEKEEEIVAVCNKVREEYDNNEQVIKDSKNLFDFIAKENIPVIKKRRPVPFQMPVVDYCSKGLVLDFDCTLFDTTVTEELRESHDKDWDRIYSLIPQCKLYDGWNEVFTWAKANNVKIGIISGAKRELIERTLQHFNIHADFIIGYQQFIGKPNAILGNRMMSHLNIREEQILYVGNCDIDDKQARCNKWRFALAGWGAPDIESFKKRGINVLNSPRDIIGLLGDGSATSTPSEHIDNRHPLDSKIFESPNGLYDIVVCHNAMDAQLYVNKSGYSFPSWCYVTSQGSFDKYTSHTKPLGEKGGVLIIFFRKDSNSTKKSNDGSISKPLLYDDYAISVFSLTTDYKKEDGKLFVRSVTNRYNLTKDIYAATKPSDVEAAELRKGLDAISKATGMDVEKFAIEHTPAIRDKRENYDMSIYDEKYNDGKVILYYPNLEIPRDKKTVLCMIKDSYGDDVAYDIQPSGAVHPHGCPHDLTNEIIDELPDKAIRILRDLYPRYVSKLTKADK